MTKTELKNMADRIKIKRKSLSYTQESFAEIIDISIGSYTKIENAFQKPSLDTLIKISKKLDVSLDYLVFGDENEEKPSNTDILNTIISNADADKIKHTCHILSKIAELTS